MDSWKAYRAGAPPSWERRLIQSGPRGSTLGKLLCFVLIGGLLGCDPAGPSEAQSQLNVVLESPFGPEGGAMIEFVGPGLSEFTAPGSELYRTTSGDTTRVIIIRQTAGTISLSITRQNSFFRPTWKVLQVSGPDNQLRSELSAYRVRYERWYVR